MKIYQELADWWPLLSPPGDYVEEASEHLRIFREQARSPVREVLELGAGGGNIASHLKAHFRLTLVEPSDGMRAVSQKLNPDCEHLPGDMRNVRLGRQFDAVFVHDAIMYMTTEHDLARAIATVSAHLRPGGIAQIAPDATAETFAPSTDLGGEDEAPDAEGRWRGLRFLMWTLPPLPNTTVTPVHFSLLLRERDGSVRSEHDAHHDGLFPRETWLRLLDQAGLDARVVPRTSEGSSYDTFVGIKR